MTKRREFLKGLAAGTLGLCMPRLAGATKHPNILWLIAEDMNPWLSCYGTTLIQTPTFDAMAAEGVRFSRAYVTGPVCSACRSALITGTMQTTLGIHNHRSSRSNTRNPEHRELGLIRLPEGVKTLPELFQQAGYATFNRDKTDYNFLYDNEELYSVRDWKEAEAQGKPWFGQIQLKGGKNGKVVLDNQNPVSPEQVSVPPYYPDHPDFREAIADHYACVLGTDLSVKRILDELQSDGLLDDTIVFFFSDHGMPKGLRHKQFCYEGGIHIPLLVRWPKNHPVTRRGLVIDDLVNSIDISVTSMALAGLPIPDHMEGRDVFADDYKPREYVISARDRCDYTIEHIRAVTTRRFRYLRNFLTDRPYLQPQYRDAWPVMTTWKRLHAEGKLTPEAAAFAGNERPAEELYDLESDPHEVRNLAGDPRYAAQLQRHRNILKKWMKETDDKGQHPESTEGLLQVMYRWGDKCVNPEYKRVRRKYGNVSTEPRRPKRR
ncbi:MAG: sulfatase family protein [Planctomycetota bacterium]|jgi:arylsulfatase A-like enzyme